DRGPAVRGHLDLRPERELGDSHRHRHGQVVAVPPEDRVWFHVNPDIQVPVPAAVLAGGALAGNPDPLPVGDAGGYAGLDGARAHRAAAPAAGLARVVHHQAAASAGLARLVHPEAAKVPALLARALA